MACELPEAVHQLWPADGFRPASGIPGERDTTDRVGGLTIPGAKTGHELFKSVDVVGEILYVAYNAGLQAWYVGFDSANPPRLDVRDGWNGQFLSYPPPGEVLTFNEDVAAHEVDSTRHVVALSGKAPVGLTLWEFRMSDMKLVQLYQDEGTVSRQVRVVDHQGTLYAITAGDKDVTVFNATAALTLTPPCLDAQGTNPSCNMVFVGKVPGVNFTRYLDAVSVGGSVYVAQSFGLLFGVQIWQLDPARPQDAVLAYDGSLSNDSTVGARAPAFIEQEGHYYLAIVQNHVLRILLVDDCLDGNGCTSPPVVVDGVDLTTWESTEEFLTVSRVGTANYLYFGVSTGNLSGSDTDHLFDLSSLQPDPLFPLADLAELTKGPGYESYVDPCNGNEISYWSHYYDDNTWGLREMHPRVGKFSPQGFFYRAAQTILDVHRLGDPVDPDHIFSDGFESGDVSRWSGSVP